MTPRKKAAPQIEESSVKGSAPHTTESTEHLVQSTWYSRPSNPRIAIAVTPPDSMHEYNDFAGVVVIGMNEVGIQDPRRAKLPPSEAGNSEAGKCEDVHRRSLYPAS